MEASELLKQAMTLSDEERGDLAARLIESLDPAVDSDVEAAWQEVVALRLRAVESGKVKTIPWEEVRRKGRALLSGM